MSRRSFLTSLLKTDAQLLAFHGGRVYQGSGMTTAQLTKPYLVYHIGNNTSEDLADDHPASRLFFMVYVHDRPGDYVQVDSIGDRIKALLMGKGSPENAIITTRFLERSQDLNDESLGTIFNYLRFQWILGS